MKFAVEDLIVYGGMLCAAVGIGWMLHPGAGLMLAGLGLMGTYYGWFVRWRVK